MDPLSLLRDFNMRHQLDKVTVQGDRVHFGDSYVFPKTAYTAFKGVQKDFYPLEVVLCLLQNRHLPQAEYIRASNASKVAAVNLADRKKLLDFLDGKADVQLDAAEGLPPALPVADDALEPAGKRARIEDSRELNGFDFLVRQERQLRDRNTMLLASNKSFQKVLEVAHRALTAHRQASSASAHAPSAIAQPPHKHKQPPGASKPAEQAIRPSNTIPIKPSGRFDRDINPEDQLKALAGSVGSSAAGVISMYGKYGSTSSSQQQAPQKQQPAAPPPPSSSGRMSSNPHHVSSSSKPGHGGKPLHGPRPSAGLPEKSGGTPIIIVPSGLTAMITMYNVKLFLEEGRFETTQAAQQRGVVKMPLVLVNRTAQRAKPVIYHVVERVTKQEDWQRVVAVIAQGAKWQFKDWPFKGAAEGNLIETFSCVCGFFFHYSDEKVPELVQNWNVKRLGLHRENRHLDMSVMLEFYKHLDSFLVNKKSTLAY